MIFFWKKCACFSQEKKSNPAIHFAFNVLTWLITFLFLDKSLWYLTSKETGKIMIHPVNIYFCRP